MSMKKKGYVLLALDFMIIVQSKQRFPSMLMKV